MPEWWTPGQRAKNNVIFAAIRFGLALGRACPFIVLESLAFCLSPLAWLVAWNERKRALRQLRQAIPEAKARRTIFAMFVHFARLAAEWVHIDRFSRPGSRWLEFSPATQQVLKDALGEGRGVFFFAPHLGNWELLAQASARHGFPCSTTAKETYDPRLTALLDDFRREAGIESLWRSDPKIILKIGAVLQRGGIVGALIDQDTKVPGVFVPFFGKLANTPVVPASIVVRHRAAVVFGYAVREGRRYRIHFERVPVPSSGDRKSDALRLTEDLTLRIEQAIRAHPEQWVWIHERWKRRPPEDANT